MITVSEKVDLRVIESNVEIAASIDKWNCDNDVVLRKVIDALSVDGIVIWATRRRGSCE
jgi:hypothetical protein